MNFMVRNVFWRFAVALSSMQAERRKNSWRSRQQDFLGPSRARRCSSSCLPFFWHRSPGLLTSMRRSNYHRYLFYPRPTRAPPGVKVATLLMVVLLWSSSWQSNLFQETFFLLFTSWTVLQLPQTVTQARVSRSSSSCTMGPSVLANCLHRGSPLHSRSNNQAATAWGSRNPAVES